MAYWTFILPLLLQGASGAPSGTAPAGQATQIAPGPTATTPALKSNSEKLICRRFQKTGTLAGYERVCRSKADWQRMTNDLRKNWRDIQGHKGWSGGSVE